MNQNETQEMLDQNSPEFKQVSQTLWKGIAFSIMAIAMSITLVAFSFAKSPVAFFIAIVPCGLAIGRSLAIAFRYSLGLAMLKTGRAFLVQASSNSFEPVYPKGARYIVDVFDSAYLPEPLEIGVIQSYEIPILAWNRNRQARTVTLMFEELNDAKAARNVLRYQGASCSDVNEIKDGMRIPI